MRRISDVTIDGYDPVAWRDRCSPMILLRAGGELTAVNSITDKRQLLGSIQEGDTLLLAWRGRYSTDVFLVDDLDRALRGMGK